MKHGISVDLEDWYSLVRRRVWGVDEPPTDRVVHSTHALLGLLSEADTHATFFVLGQVAERFPELVRLVASRGHEIATHGHTHRRVDRSDPETFRSELRRSGAAIEAACGVRPRGHRAPEFSIGRDTSWAFRILDEEGLRYDSSVFPIRHRRYGIPGAPVAPYQIDCGDGRTITELPLATVSVAGRRLPAAGGGYLRFFPYRMIETAVRQADAAGRPAIVYVHPYEFDPLPLRFEQPLPTARARFFVASQNAFRGRATPRLQRLLRTFSFGPLGALAQP